MLQTSEFMPEPEGYWRNVVRGVLPSKDSVMAKSQKKSSREIRKPKPEKPKKPNASNPSMKGLVVEPAKR